jgi:hypothetical protein
MTFQLPHLSYLSYPRDCCQQLVSGTDSFRRGHRMLLSNEVDSPFSNFGGNRANIEKEMRKLWMAEGPSAKFPDGYLFCNVDQSGAEALIVAYLCKDAKYRLLFKVGIKPHTYLALKLFHNQWHEYFDKDKVELACKTPIAEIKGLPFWHDLEGIIKDSDNWDAQKRFYHFAKKTIHAGSYGMRENTFILSMLKESEGDIVLTKEQGKQFLMGFHSEFPEIQDWQFRTFDRARKHKLLRNIFGHPYHITDYVPDDIEKCKDLIAWAPQSSVAEITRTAWVALAQHIQQGPKHWHLLIDNHDSYMAEAPAKEILDLAKYMKQFIEIEFTSPFDGSKFRMRSGVSVGKNWSPYKEGKNEEGLKEIKL